MAPAVFLLALGLADHNNLLSVPWWMYTLAGVLTGFRLLIHIDEVANS